METMLLEYIQILQTKERRDLGINNFLNLPIANYLMIAVSSGYYIKKDWQNWADNIISRDTKFEYWIYEVSIAKSKEELYIAIIDKVYEECFRESSLYEKEDCIIGYYFLMYKEGRLSFSNLLYNLYFEDDLSNDALILDNLNFKYLVNAIKKTKCLKYYSLYKNLLLEMIKPIELYVLGQQKILKTYYKKLYVN